MSSSNNRLNKLGMLLESRNRTLRTEAIATLAQFSSCQQSESSILLQLFSIVTQYSRSPVWEGRVAAAELLSELLAISKANFREQIENSQAKYSHKELQSSITCIEGMKLDELLEKYQVLLSCQDNATNGSGSSIVTLTTVQRKQQRQLVDQHLDMNSATGVSSKAFITDDELSNSNSGDSIIFNSNKLDIKKEAVEEPLYTAEPNLHAQQFMTNARQIQFHQFHTDVFKELLLRRLLHDLVDPKWHIRHGAALALTKVCIQADTWLFPWPPLFSSVTIRMLQLLCLDRFCDFVTGCNAVTPVREASAQALSGLLLKLGEAETDGIKKEVKNDFGQALSSAILGQICALLSLQQEEHWQCRQTALLVTKYHFAVSAFSLPVECQLFHATLHALVSDPVDEVVSAASQALCSLFDNPRLDESTIKGPLINQVIGRVWSLLECSDRLAQFREGVDSVLVDLLTLLSFWLRSQLHPELSANQMRLLVELLDCSAQHCPVSRVLKVLECINAILEKSTSIEDARCFGDWSEEVLFSFLKLLYRCVLFCPPSAASSILPNCQQILESLLMSSCRNVYQMDKLLSKELVQCIGLWIGCLVYEHKNPEINVFLHKIDGQNSNPNSPKEIFCGEEIRFMDPAQIDEKLLERKAFAARWLAPLLDALFHWGKPIAQQPMFISVQLLLLPYFRSNSLYQKLGATMIAQAWAMHQYIQQGTEKVGEELTENSQQQEHPNGRIQSPQIPSILAKEMEQQLSTKSDKKLYEEVTLLVNVLSRECNDFQQYCLRKGVPKAELLPLNQATSMEDAVTSAFHNCERRMQRANDKQALAARHAIVLDLIANTKLAVRTYTNRINALLSSALLFFSNRMPLPVQLTPLIKPLVEALVSETNPDLADLLFGRTFPTLFAQSAERQPCPHAKMLKQLVHGLGQCEVEAPNIAKWSDPEKRHQILSMETSGVPIANKARNCQLALSGICAQLGDSLTEKCPEILAGDFASLELEKCGASMEKLEPFLLRLDFLRLILPALADPKLRCALISEKVAPHINFLMKLLGHSNPAIRFRVAHFLADLAAIELCPMVKLFYSHLEQMITDHLSPSADFCRCGAVELLARLALMGDRLLGVCSLLALLTLRAIGDRLESIRATATTVFSQLVTLLPVEDRQKHFLPELAAQCPMGDGDEASQHSLRTAYLNSFNLVDVLTSPGSLPRLRQTDIPWLREDTRLRDYQLEGITWLSFLNRFGLNGILADDMGLGKTLQLCSLLAWDFVKRRQTQPTMPASSDSASAITSSAAEVASMIVCPRTLVDHWCNEWRTYFPHAQIPILKMKDRAYQQKSAVKRTDEFTLIISYEELRSNRHLLSERRWHYIVLDEGHCIRNPSSQLFEAVTSLQSAHRLILSGTPVQNSPADLWALFTFLMPGYLSTRAKFQTKFMRSIMACRNPKANEQQIKDGEQALQLLHKQCLPFVMRRLKSEVLAELPDKIVQDWPCELTAQQRQLYTLLVERCSLMGKSQQPADEDSQQWLGPLQVLHGLRKLVDHPWLIVDLLSKINGPAGQQFLAQNGLHDRAQLSIKQSGKMLALQELLVECQIGDRNHGGESTATLDETAAEIKSGGGHRRRRSVSNSKQKQPKANANETSSAAEAGECSSSPGCSSSPQPEQKDFHFTTPSGPELGAVTAPHRALIFCQWKATIELIAQFLDRGLFGPDISYLRLDGSIAPGDRQALVDRFNADFSIDLLLLTTHIGGVGLNLTGADVVIFVDHDWNPFRDLQAIDRAHRLGQRRTVNVYRLITQGTVEEKVMRLQQFKEQTANTLVGADNRSLASMATDELLELFSLGGVNSATDTGPKASKKPRLTSNAVDKAAVGWTMDQLWGGQGEEEVGEEEMEQYAEQHSIQTFLRSATTTSRTG